MGPSTGSPAAETQKKSVSSLAGRACSWPARRLLVVTLGAVLILPALASLPDICWARTAETSHTVTVVVVEPVLAISDDAEDLPLALDRRGASGSGNTQVVNYHLYGNVLPATAVEGVLSGKLSSGGEGIELQADVGSFANQGTPGVVELQEHATSFQEVGTNRVALADKGATSGAHAGVINGTLPITWKATTTEEDLPAGSYPLTLILTLKDS